jgi:hypothetical protein
MNKRPFRRRRPTAAALLAGLLVLCSSPPAAAHAPDPVFAGGPFSQNEILEFRWRAGDEPPAAVRSAVVAAAQDVTDSRASKAALFRYASAGPNPIGYGVDATCGVNGIACFTRTAPDSFTMWFREQGHVFDWGTLKWCQMYSTAPNGCYDVENVALDEFGHVEMLDHHVNHASGSDYRDAVVQTFSRTKPNDGYNAHAFGRCDVASLQREYDMLSWTAKYSTCLDLDTALGLTASSTSIAYRGSVTLSASLKVKDFDTYDRVGGNPVAGRRVTLQYRPVGGSTWVSIGTMSAGTTSGTYVLSQSQTSDREYRAVFATPSDEGINGSTSGVVTVRVGACTVAPCPLSAPLPAARSGGESMKEVG